MKIVIAGSHGVGKTTLAKALAKTLGFNYIHDIVREEAFKKGFQVNELTFSETQLWLTTRQWELEKITPQSWVADKCLLDYLVYGEKILKDEKDKSTKKVIKDLVRRNAHYDFVFYLPIEFPMPQDGVRSQDLEFQKDVDRRYKKCLSKFGIDYIILSGTIEQRINQALKHIKAEEKKK